MFLSFKNRWSGAGGFADVLSIALPLIVSTGLFTVQMFVDRIFLMWYASEAMAAAVLSGILSFVFFSFFLGISGYVNTFVAQYHGARQAGRIAASVWQGLYFCIAGGVVMVAAALFTGPIIDWVGHGGVTAEYEATYFYIMCMGAFPGLVASVLGCFYTGRGKTWTVMWVNMVCVTANIVLDYILIFGKLGFPRLGIAGAAIATISASVLSCVIFFVLFFDANNRSVYGSWRQRRFEWQLLSRLLRFGLPNGVQFMLDIAGFALFMVFVGRVSALAFAASSMAFQINMLAFMPMIGFGVAVSTLVGQAVGAGKAEIGARSTWSAAMVTFGYMGLIAGLYVFWPGLFLTPFSGGASADDYQAIRPIAERLLIFIAVYSLFDTGNIIFAGALKGAGDTKFVMKVSVVLNWLILVVPSYLAIKFIGGMAGLYAAWGALTVYVCLLAGVFFARFMAGKWKHMRVIEPAGWAPTGQNVAAVPTLGVDVIVGEGEVKEE
jgi:MATE family multidrug resistance protein